MKHTKLDASKALNTLKGFIGKSQLHAIDTGCWGDDRHFFYDKLCEIAERVESMPKTYEQDGLGNKAIAYLHYFNGDYDAYITEKDMDGGIDRAFGMAKFFGNEPEMGYISIREIVANGVEFDLHFEPKTLAEIFARPDMEPRTYCFSNEPK